MRRFRFVGDASEYCNDFQNGAIYDYSVLGATVSSIHMNVEWLASEYPNDWQEVFDNEGGTILTQPKTLHKDTDLGMFSLSIMNGLMSSMVDKAGNGNWPNELDLIAETSIKAAIELIKQLDEQGQ